MDKTKKFAYTKDNIPMLLTEARVFHNYDYNDKKAIERCNEILKIDSENKDAMLVKAGALDSLGKEKEAFILIKDIITKWPEHWEAYYLMGMLLFNTNENLAMNYFNKSISLKKDFNNIIAAAQLLYFLEDNKYKEYLKEAEKLNPLRFQSYMKNYWEWEIC